jgi:hypothetical protein
LFGGHRCRKNDCCCEQPADPCCKSGCGLLNRCRTARRCNDCCDPCGCNGAAPAGEGAPAAEPTPEPQPAAGSQTRIVPMMDPSAFQTPTTRFTAN